MDKDVCEKFDNVWEAFPDKLTSDNKYQFETRNFLDSYCGDNNCSTDYGKINAGFLYLLNKFWGASGLFKSCETSNINVVEYIMIWLCYMLNLKSTKDDSFTNLNNFYNANIKNHNNYNSFIELINKKKELMNISNDKVSKLYNLFKILCQMYTKIDEDNKKCNNYLKGDNEFFVEYQKLLNDSDNGNSYYNQLLSSLSTDYDKLKNECEKILSSKPKEIKQSYEDTSSSSSIGNKLISVLSIFGAIGFLLGISYKQLFVKNNKNISTVEYIIIWLSYKLNQKKYDGINNLNDFYTNCIENNTHYTSCKQDGVDCSNQLQNNTGYTNYKEIINKRKGLLNTNIEKMSKIYDAFKPLCNIYTELGGSNTENKKYLENASKFVENYKELNEDSDNTEDDTYYQVLHTLSNDYINLKDYCYSNIIDCNKIPSLIPIETEESDMLSSEEICYVTSSSLSIVKKLILSLLIFSAISIFLGIFFKVNNKKFKNYFH
ncbi:hypothetical protein YYC_05554 [Plasmodium yoelii 17X]|uniref:Uncharacterized protein n=1 Tax=Plasmodium yoelii 17X TaxID=1323249 RepID=V7PAA0_PLAYE|nr:hypothetical protein YYC_05554 [Plasmodium yoelii 17X]